MNITQSIGGYSGHRLDEKRLAAILLTIVAIIMLGYHFFVSCLLGFLISKSAAGKSTGEPGKVRSLVIPFRKWGIHLHHWLYSLCLIGLSSITGMHFLAPDITYGPLGGLVFQGVYCYSDWNLIIISRNKTRTGERAVNTSRNSAHS